jgi:hypothetical protein
MTKIMAFQGKNPIISKIYIYGKVLNKSTALDILVITSHMKIEATLMRKF